MSLYFKIKFSQDHLFSHHYDKLVTLRSLPLCIYLFRRIWHLGLRCDKYHLNILLICKRSTASPTWKSLRILLRSKVKTISATSSFPSRSPCHQQTLGSTSRVLIAVFNTILGLFFYYIIIYVQVLVHATCLWLQIFRRGFKCLLLGVLCVYAPQVTMALGSFRRI